MKKYKIAVVGATGNVGREMLNLLLARNFPCDEIFAVASSRSVGQKLEITVDNLEEKKEYLVHDLEKFDFKGIDIVFSSPGASVAKTFVPRATASGSVVIDNTSYFRMADNVPLVVPEVNGEVLKNFYQNNKTRIIANPNCSTIQLVMVLKPIHDLFGIKRVVVATYQSVSGTGKEAMDELFYQTRAVFNQENFEPNIFPKQIAFNCIPHVDSFLTDGSTKEEWKMSVETKKIIGDDTIHLIATCVRVPVFVSHAEAVFVECHQAIDLSKIRSVLASSSGVVVYDRHEPSGYATPIDTAGEDASFVSRLRIDPTVKNGLAFWCVSDNLRKGAALNAIQIGETLIQDNFGGLS
ncbi:MAG: aspartate-semialdehyde dehydrogenase [Alphaproteobacteria bacterium]